MLQSSQDNDVAHVLQRDFHILEITRNLQRLCTPFLVCVGWVLVPQALDALCGVGCLWDRGCHKGKKKTLSVQYALRWRLVGNRWRLVGNRRRLVGNRWRLVGNRRRLVGNRWRLVGNRRRLVGNRCRLVGNRQRLVGNRWG